MKFLSLFVAVTCAVISLSACGAHPSDDQQVRELVTSVENAAEERDTRHVLEHVADDYQDANGFDKPQLQNFLRGWFLAHPRVQLMVGIDELTFPADGLAQAEISVTSMSLSDPERVRLKVEFRRSGGEWRVNRADRLPP